MIIPAHSHDNLVKIDNTKAIRLVTCKKGTYIELWSLRYNRPMKNGKIALLTPKGEIALFKNVNPAAVHIDPDTTAIETRIH